MRAHNNDDGDVCSSVEFRRTEIFNYQMSNNFHGSKLSAFAFDVYIKHFVHGSVWL
jgi:hypothetical protein